MCIWSTRIVPRARTRLPTRNSLVDKVSFMCLFLCGPMMKIIKYYIALLLQQWNLLSLLRYPSFFWVNLEQNNFKVTQKLQEHVLVQEIQLGSPDWVCLNTDSGISLFGMYIALWCYYYKTSFATGLSIPHSCERKLGRRSRGRKGRKGGVEGGEKTRVSFIVAKCCYEIV